MTELSIHSGKPSSNFTSQDAYDLSQVPAEERKTRMAIISTFEKWHDTAAVSNENVRKTRDQLDTLSFNFNVKNSVFYNLRELSLERYQGGPGVIAPDGTVLGKTPQGITVRFNILTNPVVLSNLPSEQKAPARPDANTIEGRQALAQMNPEFGEMLRSPESLISNFNKALQEQDSARLAALFVPGSPAKAMNVDNDFVAVTALIRALTPFPLDGKFEERVRPDGILERCYKYRDGNNESTQEFEKHGDIWLMLP